MLRAGRRGTLASLFKTNAFVATDWYGVDWTSTGDVASVRLKLRQLSPDGSRRQRIAVAAQIERFLRAMQPGDAVVTYDALRRVFFLGVLCGPARCEPAAEHGLKLQRPVAWRGIARRDGLSGRAVRALGAMSRLFAIPGAVAEELQTKSEPWPYDLADHRSASPVGQYRSNPAGC